MSSEMVNPLSLSDFMKSMNILSPIIFDSIEEKGWVSLLFFVFKKLAFKEFEFSGFDSLEGWRDGGLGEMFVGEFDGISVFTGWFF